MNQTASGLMKQKQRLFNTLARIKILAALLLLLFAGLAYSSLDNIRFVQIAAKDGLSQQTILEIYQNTRGFLLFVMQEGINI